jgi:hypothetical protein
MKPIITTLMIFAIMLSTQLVKAQCEGVSAACEKHIMKNFVTDGQSYRALLSGQDVAEFQTTLFSGNTYRIAACSGNQDGNLIFRIFDESKNLLFSNTEFTNAPFWDFHVENTMLVTIEAMLDESRSESGCAVIIIGIKK